MPHGPARGIDDGVSQLCWSLDGARKLLSSGNPVLQKKALATLEQVVSDFPDTDLSRMAQSLIDSTKPPAEPRDDK